MSNSEPSDVIGQRVRDVRKQQGMTIEELAERCALVGAPDLTVGVLYLIEGGGRGRTGKRGRRRVTVEEVLALALALTVQPIVLLVPDEPDSPYELAPNFSATAEPVYRWLIGEQVLPGAAAAVAGPELVELAERISKAAKPDWMTRYTEEALTTLVTNTLKGMDLRQFLPPSPTNTEEAQNG